MKSDRFKKSVLGAPATPFKRISQFSVYKRVREALRGNADIFRGLAEKNVVGVYLAQDGLFRYINTKAAEILGYTVDEVINRLKVRDIVLTEDWPIVVKNMKTRSSGKQQSLDYEVRFLTKNGTVKHGEIYSARMSYQGRPAVIGTILDVTERRRIAQTLEQSEKRFRQLAEATFEGIFIHDHYIILDVNQAALQISGYSYEDSIGQDVTGIIAPEAKEMVLQNLKSAKSRPIEVPLVRKDGSCLTVEVMGKPILYNGKQVRVVALRDVTERLRMEESLREFQKRFQLITDHMIDAMWLLDMNFKVLWISPSVVRQQGYTLDEINAMPPEKRLSGDSLKIIRQTVDEELTPEKLDQKDREITKIVELEVFRKDGSSFWSEINFTLLRDKRGIPIGILGVGRNITRRRQAEQSLKMSEERFSKSFHMSPVPTIVMTLDGGWFVDANKSFLEMMGYERQEVIGRTSTELRIWANLSDRDNLYRHLVENGTVRGDFSQLKTRTGEIRDTLISAGIIVLKEKKFILAMCYDLTEQRKLEEQLRRSQKMEAIGTLTGGIAHDFNNILGGIMGYTELVMEHHIPPGHPAHPLLEGMLRGINRAKDLVAQMMAFSRQQEQKRIPLNLVPIVKEALKLLRASLPAIIIIDLHIDMSECLVFADPTQIHQVLMNLVTNAAHAMEGGRGLIDVFLKPVRFGEEDALPHSDLKRDTDYQELSVRDTGCGIDTKNLSRIFDPFFTTKKTGEGTGLGLSVVYGIVKSHDGIITVASEPGKGSTFKIYIPAMTGPVAGEEQDRGLIHGGNERILFVDDEYALTEIFSIRLTDLGYAVTTHNNPLKALEEFKRRPEDFDLVITDLTMPDMTGTDLACELTRIRPDIPILLCSGTVEELHPAQLTQLGIRQIAVKPVAMNSLAASIRRILDKV